jgi:hypothetical protein
LPLPKAEPASLKNPRPHRYAKRCGLVSGFLSDAGYRASPAALERGSRQKEWDQDVKYRFVIDMESLKSEVAA